MIPIRQFTYSPFQENTYIIIDKTHEALIVDPGCFYPDEQRELLGFIRGQKLKMVGLLNTHAHIDHIFGNALIHEHFGLLPKIHKDEEPMLVMAPAICDAYGIQMPAPSPLPGEYLEDGDELFLGDYRFEVLLTPGHSVASLSFYCSSHGFLISGDVLFKESIGRTDLPGGNYEILLNSVKEKLFTLPQDTIVYPGHGPSTTIGYEKRNNPFFR